jgi:hypothetical protein
VGNHINREITVRKHINAIPISNILNLEQSIKDAINYRLSGVVNKNYRKQIINDILNLLILNTEQINREIQQ